MKKYRVTKNHPFIKRNFEIHQSEVNSEIYVLSSVWVHPFSSDEIDSWNKNGWLEEIQEPEFTRDEVIHILNKYNTDFVSACGKCDFEELIKEWEYLKEK